MLTDRETDRQQDRETDGQQDRGTDEQQDRETDGQQDNNTDDKQSNGTDKEEEGNGKERVGGLAECEGIRGKMTSLFEPLGFESHPFKVCKCCRDRALKYLIECKIVVCMRGVLMKGYPGLRKNKRNNLH